MSLYHSVINHFSAASFKSIGMKLCCAVFLIYLTALLWANVESPAVSCQSEFSLRSCCCWISCSSGEPGGQRSASTWDTSRPGPKVRRHIKTDSSVQEGWFIQSKTVVKVPDYCHCFTPQKLCIDALSVLNSIFVSIFCLIRFRIRLAVFCFCFFLRW